MSLTIVLKTILLRCLIVYLANCLCKMRYMPLCSMSFRQLCKISCRFANPTSFLPEKEKYCKVIVDEIHHIMRFSHDESNKYARSVPMIMIAPVMGALAFVCRLIPVYFLKHDLTLEGFYLSSDDLRANQAYFNAY